MRTRAHVGLLVIAALMPGSRAAHAYDFGTSPYLLGDWGGLRTRLADEGVTFQLEYVGETAHNFSGGTEHLTLHADQWAFGTTLDLNRLWGWPAGTFQASLTDRNGHDLGAAAHIHNDMLIQEIYGRGETWHLTQFFLDQRFLDNRLQATLGRLPVGQDFASFSCDFQNLTFCTSQPGNLAGNYWLDWPSSQWAARIKYQAFQQGYVQIGAYQVNPYYVDDNYARHSGWKLGFPHGTTGVLLPLEVGWLPTFDGRSGSYKIGVWYNTSDGNDLYYDINRNPRGITGLAPFKRHGEYGAYVNIQQQVTGIGGGRGATVFLNITEADRNTTQLDGQIALGVQYRGPFHRLRDQIGFAVGATHNNSRYADFVRDTDLRTGQHTIAGDGYEYVAELYYSWSPVPSMYFRPNLQRIIHPGGSSQNAQAFAIGLKSGVTF